MTEAFTPATLRTIMAVDPDRAACHAKGYADMEALRQQHPGAESLRVDTYTVTGFPAPDGQAFDLHVMVIIVAMPGGIGI